MTAASEASSFSEATVPAPAPGGTTYLEAIRLALEDELASDDRVVLLGEDIGVMGGAFRVTQGLHERFGDERVIDTPMAEAAIIGAATGLGVTGWRPIVELQFADFISCAYDQLVTVAAKLHYRFGVAVPIVVRAPSGAGVGAGPFHSQNPEGVFAHVPGLKVVCPGTVQDAYDLLRAAVRDSNPVVYFEHKALYRSLRAPLRRHNGPFDLARPAVRLEGDDVTVVTYGGMLPRCLDAAARLAQEGICTEIVDLRCGHPINWHAIAASARKTARVVVVHEDSCASGIGAEIAARLADSELFFLDAPVRRVTAPDTPTPFARLLEDEYIPSIDLIASTVAETARC